MKTKLLTFAALALLASSAFAAAPTYLYRLYSPGVKGAAAANPLLPSANSVIATWNPADKGIYLNLSNNNLTAFGTSSGGVVRATQGKSSGKWYWDWELTQTGTSSTWMVGILDSTPNIRGLLNYQGLGQEPNSLAYGPWSAYSYYHIKWPGTTVQGFTVPVYVMGTTLMYALDMDNHALYLGRDGVWLNASDPTSGAAATGAVLRGSGLVGTVFPGASSFKPTDAVTANFGATTLKYPNSVPTGYHAGVFQ